MGEGERPPVAGVRVFPGMRTPMQFSTMTTRPPAISIRGHKRRGIQVKVPHEELTGGTLQFRELGAAQFGLGVSWSCGLGRMPRKLYPPDPLPGIQRFLNPATYRFHVENMREKYSANQKNHSAD